MEDLIADLGSTILQGLDDNRLSKKKSGQVRVRTDTGLLAGFETLNREQHAELLGRLEEFLGPHGWTIQPGGWWQPPLLGAGLGICTKCGRVSGMAGGWNQNCDCIPTIGRKRSNSGDRTTGQLCRCCAQVLLKSGRGHDVWFCNGCLALVREIDLRIGSYAIPICKPGRWNQYLVPSFLSSSEAQREQLAATPLGDLDLDRLVGKWGAPPDVRSSLKSWAAKKTLEIVRERRTSQSDWIPISDYLDRCRDDTEEKVRCFHQMIEWIQSQGESDMDKGLRPDSRSPEAAATEAQVWLAVHGFTETGESEDDEVEELLKALLSEEPKAELEETAGFPIPWRWVFPDGSAVALGLSGWESDIRCKNCRKEVVTPTSIFCPYCNQRLKGDAGSSKS
jgi:hypothetical protein